MGDSASTISTLADSASVRLQGGMNRENIIAGLKRLNRQDLITFNPKEHAAHMLAEGDRAAIILFASSIEGTLTWLLKEKMPSLNGEEAERVFNFQGPCGSFSSRIQMAHALGIIDRSTRKQIELIKEMRNAAAHSFSPIRYDTPEIHAAIASFFPSRARKDVMSWDHLRVRAAFSSFASRLALCLTKHEPVDCDAFYETLRHLEVRPRTLPGK